MVEAADWLASAWTQSERIAAKAEVACAQKATQSRSFIQPQSRCGDICPRTFIARSDREEANESDRGQPAPKASVFPAAANPRRAEGI